jgi:Protein of unknown function (DUF3750).
VVCGSGAALNKVSQVLQGEVMKRVVLLALAGMMLSACSNDNWRTASREPAGIAADPNTTDDAIIEVYAADAFSWRGWFAVHTWIATKAKGADHYQVYEVVGWRVKRGLPALSHYQTKTPDRYWFGAKPDKVLSVQGTKAEQLIPKVAAAIDVYPWANEYRLFPGPNSNTFPAWVGLQVPELGLSMSFRAIGSGYAD